MKRNSINRKAILRLVVSALVAGLVPAGVSGIAGASERDLASAPSASVAGNAGKPRKGKLRRYKGKLAGGGKLALGLNVKRGKPRQLREFSYAKVPARCTVTAPPVTIEGGFNFKGVKVRKGAFQGDGEDDGSTFFINGRFSRNLKSLKGEIQVTSYFPPSDPPEETCTTARTTYAAAR